MPKFAVEVDLDLNDYLSDPDAVRHDVINTIVKDFAAQVRLPWLSEEADRKALGESVSEQITSIVREIVTSEVQSIASGEFVPTNRWGEKRGERGRVGYDANGPKTEATS